MLSNRPGRHCASQCRRLPSPTSARLRAISFPVLVPIQTSDVHVGTYVSSGHRRGGGGNHTAWARNVLRHCCGLMRSRWCVLRSDPGEQGRQADRHRLREGPARASANDRRRGNATFNADCRELLDAINRRKSPKRHRCERSGQARRARRRSKVGGKVRDRGTRGERARPEDGLLASCLRAGVDGRRWIRAVEPQRLWNARRCPCARPRRPAEAQRVRRDGGHLRGPVHELPSAFREGTC